MKLFKKKPAKSDIIDYVLPCILIGIALLTSIYLLNTMDILKLSVIDNQNNEIKPDQEEIIKPNIGLKKTIEGNLYLNTVSGKKIYIPKSLENRVKNALVDYFVSNNKPENPSKKSIYKGWKDPISSEYFTRQYSFLLKALVEDLKNPVDKSMISTMADYGVMLADIEEKLTDIRDSLFELMLKSEIDKLYYQQAALNWKEIWINYFKCLKKPDLPNCPVRYLDMSSVFTELNDAYISYRKTIKSYKTQIKKLTPKAETYYEDLTIHTGKNFDLLLDTLKEQKLISPDVKTLAVSLAEEIKDIKNSISLNKNSTLELTALIEVDNPNIQEKMSSFSTIEITINDLKPMNINCIANCIFKGRTNCPKECTK